jgi:hypothetical protein
MSKPELREVLYMITVRRNNIVRFLPWTLILITLFVLIGCGNPFVRSEARDDMTLSLVLGSSSEAGSRGIFTDADFDGKNLRVVLFRDNNGSPGTEIARSNSVIQSKNGSLVAEVSISNAPVNTSVILRGQIIDGGLVYFQGLSQPFVPSSTAINLALNETVFNKLEYWFTFEEPDEIDGIDDQINNKGRSAVEFNITSNGVAFIEDDYIKDLITYGPITGDRLISFKFGGTPSENGGLTLFQSENFLINSFTTNVWILVDEVNANEDDDEPEAILLSFLTSSGDFISEIGFYEKTDGIVFFKNTSESELDVQSPPINPNDSLYEGWNMLTTTLTTGDNGTVLQIYINGMSYGDPTIRENPTNIFSGARQVAFGFGGDESNSGAFDDIRIYSQAMTASQVLALYNATKPH